MGSCSFLCICSYKYRNSELFDSHPRTGRILKVTLKIRKGTFAHETQRENEDFSGHQHDGRDGVLEWDECLCGV